MPDPLGTHLDIPMPHPRKRFGQNFLHDPGTIARILAAIAPKPGDPLVEIGPGRGAITQGLLTAAGRLDVVEIDRDLIPQLADRFPPQTGLTIHNADALAFDFCVLCPPGERLRLVGNLPYNISTPLLFRFLEQTHCIQDMHLMLQKEVVERIAAEPGGRDYGRLTVGIQAYCRVDPLFTIGPGAFTPAPKVDSAFLRLTPLPPPAPPGARPRHAHPPGGSGLFPAPQDPAQHPQGCSAPWIPGGTRHRPRATGRGDTGGDLHPPGQCGLESVNPAQRLTT